MPVPHSDKPNQRYEIAPHPIGVVHSPIASREDMPKGGLPASIEVFPEFEEGLEGIEDNTHIMAIAWLHEAARDRLKVMRPGDRQGSHPRGVFSTRSPNRPNPVGVMTARLLRREGRILYLDRLDMVDGTPVLDIKPHAPGFDGAFSARTARELSPNLHRDPRRELLDLLHEAASFHGEICPGLALGVRIMYHTMTAWGVAQKDPKVSITLGEDGCITDALQALSGATFGNRRLAVGRGKDFILQHDARRLTYTLKELKGRDADYVLSAEESDLFQITETTTE